MSPKRTIIQLVSLILNLFLIIYIINSNPNQGKSDFGDGESDREYIGNEPTFKVTQRGNYIVLNNYIRSTRKFNANESVTLATHSDYEYLENLIPLTERWNGPISVAIYAPSIDFRLFLSRILHLRLCRSRKLRELVTFHLYFPEGSFPREIPSPREVEVDCELPPPPNLDRERSRSFPYPINVGRNIARENSMTRHLLVSDIELFPSPGLAEKFLEFMNGSLGESIRRRVYAIPVFEITSEAEIPRNKTELVALMRTGKARIFHKEICSQCHRIPRLEEWLEMRERDDLNVFHVAKRMDDLADWEPIFIGTNDEPFYDERLIWEGKRDKMAQGYVMCVLDYEFHILDNAFLTHKPGFKRPGNSLFREYVIQKTLVKLESVIIPQLRILFGHRDGCKW